MKKTVSEMTNLLFLLLLVLLVMRSYFTESLLAQYLNNVTVLFIVIFISIVNVVTKNEFSLTFGWKIAYVVVLLGMFITLNILTKGEVTSLFENIIVWVLLIYLLFVIAARKFLHK